MYCSTIDISYSNTKNDFHFRSIIMKREQDDSAMDADNSPQFASTTAAPQKKTQRSSPSESSVSFQNVSKDCYPKGKTIPSIVLFLDPMYL
jgi:hypothetical protein